MTLDDYRTTPDSNAFWRLSSGEQKSLIDEACERLAELEEFLPELAHSFRCEPDMSGRHRYRCLTRSWPLIQRLCDMAEDMEQGQ